MTADEVGSWNELNAAFTMKRNDQGSAHSTTAPALSR